MFTAPTRLGSSDWATGGILAAGVITLAFMDNEMRGTMSRNSSPLSNRLSDIGRAYGTGVYGLALAAGMYSGGLLLEDDGLRETGTMVGEAIIFSAAFGTILKHSLGRSRPYTEQGSSDFHGPTFNSDATSFPSGHSTMAFAISTVLAGRARNPIVSMALYSLAGVTALSRVYDDAHWISDTFAGAAIGTVTGLAILRYRSENPGKSEIRLIPVMGGLSLQLGL